MKMQSIMLAALTALLAASTVACTVPELYNERPENAPATPVPAATVKNGVVQVGLCPAGQVHQHRISPALVAADPKFVEYIRNSVLAWSSGLDPLGAADSQARPIASGEVKREEFPQEVVIGGLDTSRDPQRDCTTYWLAESEASPMPSGIGSPVLAVTDIAEDESGVYRFVKLSLSVSDPFMKRQLTIHEMGHVLGLGDSKSKYSVMWPHIEPGRPITCADLRDVCIVNGCSSAVAGKAPYCVVMP